MPGDIAVLANCPKLEKFDAWKCEAIRGEEPSRNITLLARVTSTPLDDVSANLPRGCCVPGDIAVLANCPKLEKFEVRYCDGIRGEEPSCTLAG